MTRRTMSALKSRRVSSLHLALGLLAACSLLSAPAFAQDGDATTRRPGVIQRAGDAAEESGEETPRTRPAAQRQAPAARSAGEQETISSQNVDPTEQFNLPPNFDPTHRARRTPGNVRVTIDFRQANLEEVVKFFSGAMSINFIVADSLKANKTITIISPTEVTLDEAYRAFLAALEMNGLTIVPFGNFLKIVEAGAAISEPMIPYEAGDAIPNEARMVTAIVPVNNARVEEVQEVISKFTTKSASIIPYHSSLIITENAANLRRIQHLIERLDRGESASNVFVYKVMYADAQDIANKLKEIFETSGGSRTAAQARQQPANRRARAQQTQGASPEAGGGAGGGGGDLEVEISEIIADDRTNQLIIVSNQRSFARIREMIELLDVPTAVGGQIHVKFLEYANSEELAGTLSSLASGVQSQRGRTATTQARGSAAPTRAQAAAGATGDGSASLLQGEVQITAHKPTNALVVVASPRDFLALENVINMLDRPRRQVYVEAVIMEVGLDVNRKIGVGFNAGLGQDFGALIPQDALDQGLIDDTRGLMLGQSNYQGIEQALGGAGGALGLLGPMVQIPGTSISLPAFALLLQATQTDNSVNILSTPAILTMDNEEAEIVVGERVPFLRGLSGGGGGAGLSSLLSQVGGQAGAAAGALGGLGGLGGLLGGGLISPIEYEDVGITLRILPQVNESSYVRLEVDQEVSDIKGAGGLGAGAPIRTRRNAKTTVLVKDQSTVVIGGLIRDVENDTIEKVPFLGDIPVVGVLFRNKSSITTKQNLILMLTPYIIESEDDLKKIYDRKMEERRELLRLFGQRDLQYMRNVNFQKKSGLIERMRQEISGARYDEEARRQALDAFEDDGPRYRILGSGSGRGQGQGEGRGRGPAEQDAEPASRSDVDVHDIEAVE